MSIYLQGLSVIRATKRKQFMESSLWNTDPNNLEELIDELILREEQIQNNLKLYRFMIIFLFILVMIVMSWCIILSSKEHGL